ncbi:hypothetical protein V1478_012211 [Vespula squamosa]|uniref:Uncharacterized protein n=1 Tax=Vespula squamosa TaxID=30214 RepID=A0ABD2ACS4_VESSQ
MEISQNNSVVPNAPSPIPICGGNSKELPRKSAENISCSPSEVYPNQRDFSYYVFPREQYPQSVSSINGPMSLLNAGVEERSVHQIANLEQQSHVFLYSDISSSPYPITEFAFPSKGGEPMIGECPSLLNLPGNDARRRVEAALEAVEEERQREYGMNVKKEEQILTPPSSNPVSPAPSPDPLDLAIPVRETLILPPRKRCKMILESMESERSASLLGSQRQSSVIHFARAS